MALEIKNISARKLFLADGAGAFLTAIMTGLVLHRFVHFFGMPRQPLLLLSLIACGYSVYAFSCYRLLRRNHAPYLKIIAVANFTYGCITIGVVIYHRATVTAWGWTYFLAETVIILVLAYIELKKGAALTRQKRE